MSVLIKDMEMPKGNECLILTIYPDGQCFEHVYNGSFGAREERKAVPVPPHGDLIDRDALIKDGWLCLHKEVVRMGGYAIHEMPLKNPSIPVVIESEE